MITFKQLQEKLSDKEYKEVDALLNRDTLLRGKLMNPTQRQKFASMSGRETFRRLKRNEDGRLRIDRGTEKKIKVNTHTVSKNFPKLSEGAMAIPVAAGIASKVLPAAAATIGAVGTMMQAKRKYRTRLNPGKRSSGRVLSPAEKKLFDKAQRDTDQKVTDQKPRDKVVKKILDRKYEKNRERMKIPNRIQSDRRRLLRGIARGEVMLDQFIPTNNASSGNIAGLPPDSPPVKNKRGSGMKNRKKKKYAYGGRGSRKMWMT